MDALSSDEELGPLLEAVWVTEGHFGQGSATARVMDNILTEQTIIRKSLRALDTG